jgi:hypothetical protein
MVKHFKQAYFAASLHYRGQYLGEVCISAAQPFACIAQGCLAFVLFVESFAAKGRFQVVLQSYTAANRAWA